MKRLTSSLVAMAICILSDGYAFGQSPQGPASNQGGHQSNGTNQSTQWNNCPTCNDGGYQHATSRYDSRCSHGGSHWTRPLCPNGCLARCCADKAFPDAGWNAPAHLPVNYDGVWYGTYLPQHAYGTPGGGFIANYPTVYQPTDTTQLGYYYHKVPTWQSRSDMIPGVPNPSNFHSRVCPQGGAGCHGYHGAAYGHVNYGPVPASCPNGSSDFSSTTPQNTSSTKPQNTTSARPQNSTSKGRQVVRATQPKRQSLFDGFRLASMTELFD